jgi:hypothetical protein
MTTPRARRPAAIAVTALLAFAVAACGGSAASSAPSAAPSEAASTAPATPEPSVASPSASAEAPAATPGASLATTGRIELADKGFAVTLPDGWTRIDLEADDLEQIMAAAGSVNPELAGAYSAQIKAMLATGLVLFAFGPDPLAGTNVNILTVPNPGLTLDFLEAANVAQIKAMAQGEVVSERVTLPAGEALHLTYQIGAADATASPTIDQYLLLTPTSQVMVSVTNASTEAAQQIVESIEVLS